MVARCGRVDSSRSPQGARRRFQHGREESVAAVRLRRETRGTVPCRGESCACASTFAAGQSRSPGARRETPRTMPSFSSSSRLQVPYTSRPPGRTSRAAAARSTPASPSSPSMRAGRLTPLQVRVAAQRPEPAARRIDEHAVGLAREAEHAAVLLVSDELRLARWRARRGRASASDSRAGARTCRKRRAARANCMRSPSSSVLPPAPAQKSTTRSRRFGATKQPDELAAFVLHLDRARAKQLVPVDQRVSLQTYAERGVRCGLRRDAVAREAREHRVARRLASG